jgi:hypothetical protein
VADVGDRRHDSCLASGEASVDVGGKRVLRGDQWDAVAADESFDCSTTIPTRPSTGSTTYLAPESCVPDAGREDRSDDDGEKGGGVSPSKRSYVK